MGSGKFISENGIKKGKNGWIGFRNLLTGKMIYRTFSFNTYKMSTKILHRRKISLNKLI